MRRSPAPGFVAIVLGVALLGAAPAMADFGFEEADLTFTDLNGSASMQAGSHPFATTTTLKVNTVDDPEKGEIPDGAFKDLTVELPPGFTGTSTPVEPCSTTDFLKVIDGYSSCPDSTAIGVALTEAGFADRGGLNSPVYSLEPSPGVAAKIGFVALEIPVTVDVAINPDPPYNIVASVTNIAQAALFYGSKLSLWGNPAAEVHDPYRGTCVDILVEPTSDIPGETASRGNCPVSIPEKPFITLPRACEGPLETTFNGVAWNTGETDRLSVATHDSFGSPQGMTGCSKLKLVAGIEAQTTSDHAESPTGLDFSLDVTNGGLTNPTGDSNSDIKKAVVTLPKGVTLNPSAAEGLAVCTPEDFRNEKVDSEPGEGCPQASKVGTVEVETPLLEGKLLRGSVFVAQQDDPATTTPGAENPFDSMIAIYQVIKNPELGIVIKLAGKVEPDPVTGQLVTTFDDLPQQPFSHFRFHLREGGRSPLITPPGCGTFVTEAVLTPWANPGNPLPTRADFQIVRGVGGAPCPAGAAPPFLPGFEAGSINNNAGSYTDFYMRLTRRDGDQDMTRFDSILPPGLLGKLAGISKCPEGAIALAKQKTGRQELAGPSCPSSSQIGRTLAGAGVGSQLTYVPGKLHLAGPFGGAPLSVVAVTPAVAGPFDAGTVVVREALSLDPVTAEVRVDGGASDPIPHILKGIPLKVRDLRVYVDRDDFILNPTGCNPSQVRASIWGGGSEVFSRSDDAAVTLATRFQAANCASLGFKPNLSFRLEGGTKRGSHPALRAVLRPRPGDANLARTVVRLPRSAFLDQGHIRTICTRVQFAADSCPPGSIYGRVTVFTPLLEEPLRGPAYLRSSNNLLPDLVFDLKGTVEIEASARIDSIKGGIRAIFPAVPDAPITKVVVNMQGGKKGLIVNSRDLCAAPSRATVELDAHNGKRLSSRPLVRAERCAKQRHGKGRQGKRQGFHR